MINSLPKALFGLALHLVPFAIFAQCNGHSELCNKRYNQVAYLTTHNAFNAEDDGFNLPNQTHGLTQQLNDGVRGLMLDVYDEGGVATVYHGFSFLGTTTLESNLTEIKNFLDANPNEVVTLLFETYISANMMDTVMTQVGLKPMLHVQTLGDSWPTLQEIIDTDKRLIFFSDHDNAEAGQDWYHYMWDFAVETDFENHSPSDFNCEFNRGNAGNNLFIVNHFVTDATIGIGQTDQAEVVNELSFFYDRVYGCQLEQQKFPNFPTVDFYELGQTLATVDSLNGIPTSVGLLDYSENSFSISPNPSSGVFKIEMKDKNDDWIYSISNLSGEHIIGGKLNKAKTIELTNQPRGIYFLSISNSQGTQIIKLVKLTE